jgi:peptide deformylase
MIDHEHNDAIDLSNTELVLYPDPRLRAPCERIQTIDDSLDTLIEQMIELMFNAKGVGLAAPQVGISVQLFIASPTFESDDLHVYINPKITEVSRDRETEEEGCLSFPLIYNNVSRGIEVTLEYVNLDGDRVSETITDPFHARIIQHEMDHLEGRLLVDGMGPVAKLQYRKALKLLEKNDKK